MRIGRSPASHEAARPTCVCAAPAYDGSATGPATPGTPGSAHIGPAEALPVPISASPPTTRSGASDQREASAEASAASAEDSAAWTAG